MNGLRAADEEKGGKELGKSSGQPDAEQVNGHDMLQANCTTDYKQPMREKGGKEPPS